MCLELSAGSHPVPALLWKMGTGVSRSPPWWLIGKQRFCNDPPSCDMHWKLVLCQQPSVQGAAAKLRCCMNTFTLPHCYFMAWADKVWAPWQHTRIQPMGLGLSFAPEQREGKRSIKTHYECCPSPSILLFQMPSKGCRGKENHHPLIQNRSWLSYQHKQTTPTPPLTLLLWGDRDGLR